MKIPEKINLRHTSMVLGSGRLPGSNRRQETVVSTKSLLSSVPEQGLWKYVFPIEDTTSTTYSISWGWAKRTNGFVGKLELSCTVFIFCFNIDYKDNLDKSDKHLNCIIKNKVTVVINLYKESYRKLFQKEEYINLSIHHYIQITINKYIFGHKTHRNQKHLAMNRVER